MSDGSGGDPEIMVGYRSVSINGAVLGNMVGESMSMYVPLGCKSA